MSKQTRFLILLLALFFVTAWMLMLWRVPAVRSDIFTNPYLNLFTGYTLSILALAALILILTALLSSRENRWAYIDIRKLHGAVHAPGFFRLPKSSDWFSFGRIAALVSAALTVLLKIFSLPGTAVFSFRSGELLVTLVLAGLYAAAMEIFFRYSLITLGMDANVRSGGIMIFCVVFSALSGYYFPMLGGFFGLLIGAAQGTLSARAMLDTRGTFWPWAIHFVQAFVMMAFTVVTA